MTVAAQQIDDQLFESLHGVDASEDGIFKNVKLCGLESKNGRTYPEATLREAVPLYEGVPIYINHPEPGRNPSARGYGDRFGQATNPHFRPGQGIFGNVKYNPEHAMAKRVKYDIENKTPGVGLSHVVHAKAVRRAGKDVVESIQSVASVDIVDGPATNNSFFEQTSGDSDVKIADITLEQLKKDRPDLLTAIAKEQEGDANHQALQKKLDDVTKDFEALKRTTAVDAEIKDAGLTPEQVDPVFRQQLVAMESVDARKAFLKPLVDLVKAQGGGTGATTEQSKSLSTPSSKAPNGTTQESTKVGSSFADRKKFLTEQNRRR